MSSPVHTDKSSDVFVSCAGGSSMGVLQLSSGPIPKLSIAVDISVVDQDGRARVCSGTGHMGESNIPSFSSRCAIALLLPLLPRLMDIYVRHWRLAGEAEGGGGVVMRCRYNIARRVFV